MSSIQLIVLLVMLGILGILDLVHEAEIGKLRRQVRALTSSPGAPHQDILFDPAEDIMATHPHGEPLEPIANPAGFKLQTVQLDTVGPARVDSIPTTVITDVIPPPWLDQSPKPKPIPVSVITGRHRAKEANPT